MIATITIKALLDTDLYDKMRNEGIPEKTITENIKKAFGELKMDAFVIHAAPVQDYEVDQVELGDAKPEAKSILLDLVIKGE